MDPTQTANFDIRDDTVAKFRRQLLNNCLYDLELNNLLIFDVRFKHEPHVIKKIVQFNLF